MEDGVVAAALELLAIDEVRGLLSEGRGLPFTDAELAYARSKSDPERRLAARLAAKRAAARLLGPPFDAGDFEVRRASGCPPRLVLSARAERRLRELGADRVLVSLSHGRAQAAASVLLLRNDR